jgi:hypothetical protein
MSVRGSIASRSVGAGPGVLPPISEGVGVSGIEPDGSPSDDVYFLGA